MATKRMRREEFFGTLAPLGEERLQKVLWNLYWRGTAHMRERIEAELEPDHAKKRRPAPQPVDPRWVLDEVSEFVELARSGAYMGGDRRVRPRERTRWRFTFQRLASDALAALREEDPASGAKAVEQLIDLACEMGGVYYFRSEDPVAAARFVVSDAAAQLWTTLRERYGFGGFAQRAAPQLIRWESPYGWTRTGDGPISEKETTLTHVAAGMLSTPDTWIGFADRYLDALDGVAREAPARPMWVSHSGYVDYSRKERARRLREWHLLLCDKLVEYEADSRLDRLAEHPALDGPELTFLHARLAHHRRDVERARTLVQESLTALPGHRGFHEFAAEIGAELPPLAQEAASRLVW